MDNTSVDTIIGIHVLLKGNLKNKGSIQVNGTIEGEVRSDEHINIGETAKVKGPVVAKTVEVSGEVTGLIEATERLEIKPTGKVMGDINAKSLIIQQGATFVGKSIMPNELKASADQPATESAASKSEEKKDSDDKDDDNKDRDPLGFFRK